MKAKDIYDFRFTILDFNAKKICVNLYNPCYLRAKKI